MQPSVKMSAPRMAEKDDWLTNKLGKTIKPLVTAISRTLQQDRAALVHMA